MNVGSGVGVSVGATVGVGTGVLVGVIVGIGVLVDVGMGVDVGTGVFVAVGTAVDVGGFGIAATVDTTAASIVAWTSNSGSRSVQAMAAIRTMKRKLITIGSRS